MNVMCRKVAFILVMGAVVGLAIAKANWGVVHPITAEKAEAPSAPRLVDLADALQAINATNAVVLDVRGSKYYAHSHIPNAVNFPADSIQQMAQTNLATLREASGILIYCDGVNCGSAIAAARFLIGQKITTAKVYFPGFEEWITCHLPIEKGIK